MTNVKVEELDLECNEDASDVMDGLYDDDQEKSKIEERKSETEKSVKEREKKETTEESTADKKIRKKVGDVPQKSLDSLVLVDPANPGSFKIINRKERLDKNHCHPAHQGELGLFIGHENYISIYELNEKRATMGMDAIKVEDLQNRLLICSNLFSARSEEPWTRGIILHGKLMLHSPTQIRYLQNKMECMLLLRHVEKKRFHSLG